MKTLNDLKMMFENDPTDNVIDQEEMIIDNSTHTKYAVIENDFPPNRTIINYCSYNIRAITYNISRHRMTKQDHGNELKFYLAGKIERNCWRESIIPLRGISDDVYDLGTDSVDKNTGYMWPLTKYKQHWYTGPYFVSCDHGCYHGENQHGVGVLNGGELQDGLSHSRTVELCLNAIKASDFMIVFFNDLTAYGTIAEIAIASAQGIPVIVSIPDDFNPIDAWFCLNLPFVYTTRKSVNDVLNEILTKWTEIDNYLKSSNNSNHKRQKIEAPTEKQILFLKSLGCKEQPISKQHASELIGQYKTKIEANRAS